MVADTLGIFTSASINKYEPSIMKSQCRANKLFAISRTENNRDRFPLNILSVQR